jgi:hypothetical protein
VAGDQPHRDDPQPGLHHQLEAAEAEREHEAGQRYTIEDQHDGLAERLGGTGQQEHGQRRAQAMRRVLGQVEGGPIEPQRAADELPNGRLHTTPERS